MKGLFEKKDVSASFSKTHSKIKPSENNLETHFRRLYSTSIWPLSELTLSSQQGCADVRKDWRPGHVSLAPPCSNPWSFGPNVLYWRKYLWHCWDFSALLSDSTLGFCAPFAMPLVPQTRTWHRLQPAGDADC